MRPAICVAGSSLRDAFCCLLSMRLPNMIPFHPLDSAFQRINRAEQHFVELQQHVTTRLTQLRALGPNVRLTPLGDVRLGANDAPRSEKPEIRCDKCL